MDENAKKSFSDDQLLRIDDVSELTTLSKSCIKLWVAQGKFVEPVSLSPTVKVWQMRSLRAWMDARFNPVGQALTDHDRFVANQIDEKLISAHQCDRELTKEVSKDKQLPVAMSRIPTIGISTSDRKKTGLTPPQQMTESLNEKAGSK